MEIRDFKEPRFKKNRVCLFGIEIDNLNLNEVIDEIERIISSNEKGYIITTNGAHIVLVQKDEEFKIAYEKAKFVLADGMPLIWASKILGTPLKQRITGMDIFWALISHFSKRNYRIFLLGGTKEIVEGVYKVVKNIASFEMDYHHGYFNEDLSPIEKINSFKPHILFIGLGFPKQEKWILKYISQIDVNIAICVGGIFDIIAGKFKRAPIWMQNIGLEWFFRLIQEPERLWRRYLIGGPKFFWLFIKELIKKAVNL